MPDSMRIAIEFVEGRIDVKSFEASLYSCLELESFLSSMPEPQYAHTGHTLYHYLIALDYSDIGDIISAQGAINEALAKIGVSTTLSKCEIEKFDIILLAQPKWLNADPALINNILNDAPTLKNKSQLIKWVKERLLEKFRYVHKPPAWLQQPNWPTNNNGPLVFLGQVAVDGYFHDSGAVYIFHDIHTNECVTVIQTH